MFTAHAGRLFLMQRCAGPWNVWEVLGHTRAIFRTDLSIIGGQNKTRREIRRRYPGSRIEVVKPVSPPDPESASVLPPSVIPSAHPLWLPAE